MLRLRWMLHPYGGGLTQAQLAEKLGKHQTEVSATLREWRTRGGPSESTAILIGYVYKDAGGPIADLDQLREIVARIEEAVPRRDAGRPPTYTRRKGQGAQGDEED